MSEALAVYDAELTNLEIPKGCHPRQIRLARLILGMKDDDSATWVEIMLKAGYSAATARSDARNTRERPGVQRAIVALQRHRADRATGLISQGSQLLADADHTEISDRDKVFLGQQLIKTGTEIGETAERSGDGSQWRERQRRCARLAYRFGMNAARAQHLVLSPAVIETTEK